MTPEYLTERWTLHWSHQQADVSDEWAAGTLQLTHPWCKTLHQMYPLPKNSCWTPQAEAVSIDR